MNNYLSQKIKILSFVLILMVVFLHAYNLDEVDLEYNFIWFLQNIISYGLTRVAVPLFFLISGYLFFQKKEDASIFFIEKIKKRLRTLLVPFLIWSLFGLLFYFILQSIPPLQGFFSKGLIRNYSLLQIIDKIFVHPIAYQLWFIRDLFVLVLIAPLLYQCILRFKRLFIVLVLIPWGIHIEEFHNSIEALLFFYVGGYMALFNQEKVMNTISKRKTIVLLIAWFAFVVCSCFFQMIGYQPFIINLVYQASILIGLLAVWYFYDWLIANNQLKKDSLLYILSLYTFFIYIVHEPLLTIYKKILFFVLKGGTYSFLVVYFVTPILTIITAIGMGKVLKYLVPSFYKIITGNR